jgi:hypothetical protein
MMFFAKEETLWQAMSRTEMPLSGILATDDDGKRYAQMLSLIGCDVPLVSIGQVFKDNLWDVQFLAVTTLFGQRWHRQQSYHHQENYRL